MDKFLKAVKENPVETTMLSVGVVLGLALGLLTILGYSNIDIAIGVSLEILAIIAAILFFIHGRANRVERTTQETTKQLQLLESHMEEIRLRPWRLSEVFDSFGQRRPELTDEFKKADQVWILSRTCRRLWTDFGDELTSLIEKDKVRLLLLDPDGHALGMTSQTAIWDRPADGYNLGRDVARFLKRLEPICQKDGPEQCVRKIDYLPAWSLILVNPGGQSGAIDGGKIYVEMATYRADSSKRPCFTILSDKDYDLFSEFRDEYRMMWDEAKDAW